MVALSFVNRLAPWSRRSGNSSEKPLAYVGWRQTRLATVGAGPLLLWTPSGYSKAGVAVAVSR